jgi:aminopeptidase N
VTLNGVEVDTSGWSAEKGLSLSGLTADNTLVVDGDFLYSSSGQGLHRSLDPVDKEVYLYSQFETADAQRVFACFDQPDLKSIYTWHATVPGTGRSSPTRRWTAPTRARSRAPRSSTSNSPRA